MCRKTISGLILTSMVMFSCSMGFDETESKNDESRLSLNWCNTVDDREEKAIAADVIGSSHNEMLSELYNELEKAYESKNSNRSEATFLNKTDVDSIVDSFFGFNSETSRSIAAEDPTDETLYESEMPSELEPYIYRIEEIKYREGISYEEVISEIEEYETEVIRTSGLSEENIITFLSYSATTRASLAYWTENIDAWDALVGEVDTEIATKGLWSKIKSWFTKNTDRIKYSAASDAAGAAVGAAVGASIGSSIPGVGTAIGAEIGAVVVGAASSSKAWSQAKFCIVVPLTKLEKQINAEAN